MSIFPSSTQNTIDHLCSISPTIRDFIDGELYRGNIENTYEFTPEYLFPLCIQLLIKELQLLGVFFSLNSTDLFSEKDNIDACIALREFLDGDSFKLMIEDNEKVIKCCRTLFQSQDISEKDYLVQIIDLIKGNQLGDQLQLNQIQPLNDYLISNSSFTAHILAILDQCITKSKITETTMFEYSEYANEVINKQLSPLFQRLKTIADDHNFDSEVTLISTQDYFNFWTDFDHISELIWLSKLTPVEANETQVNQLIEEIYLTRYQKAVFSVFHYQNKVIPVAGLKLILLHQVLSKFIQSRSSQYPRLRHLISDHSDDELRILKSIATPEQQIQIDQLLTKLMIINKE